MKSRINLFKGLVFLGLVLFVGFYFLREINLITADLGRHLKNGEMFVESGRVIKSNFYSYTQTDKKVVNHHWLSGVIFYLVKEWAGFAGLSWFYSLGMMASFYLFFKAGEIRGGFLGSVLVGVLVAPILGSRVEIRPELFSYLFLGLSFYLAEYFYKHKKAKPYVLLSLVLVQFLWVNLHLFFVLGWGVLAGYFVRSLLERKKEKARWCGVFLFLVVGASFLNPFFLEGVIEPFFIFRDFGYRLLENQNLAFLLKRFPQRLLYWYYLIVSFLAVMVLAFKFDWKRKWFETLGVLAGVFAGVFMLRLFTLSGFLFLMFVPSFLSEWQEKHKGFVVFAIGFIPLLLLGLQSRDLSPVNGRFGVGLRDGVEDSAGFFRDKGVEGKVFNNYDIGGYLIYELYPDDRVFVDNRPEAYSSNFLQEKYIKGQEDEKVWKELNEEYGFEVIYFYRRDLTPWAQPFLLKRVKDDEWVPVYVDDQVLILVKKDGKNSELAEKWELPREMFVER